MPVVAVENVYKTFGSHKVLNGISLRVNRGETLAVLGRSGTGKSVLLRLIIGLETPDSGSVSHSWPGHRRACPRPNGQRSERRWVFSFSMRRFTIRSLSRRTWPFRLNTIARDMSKSERGDRVKQLLAEVGMEGDFDKMPSDISGGMQKRVGLARALALEPEILLLDEPTAGLDPISSGEIDDLILKLQREHQMASIVVTHDLHSARTIADRLALLDQGDVVIEGTFEDLQQSDIGFVKEFLKQS